MDVDDLGQLFGQGFRHQDSTGTVVNTATLVRVASLSAALSRYFEGWVGELCRDVNRTEARKGNELVYAIYSGGDDLFIVGTWDVLPELARRIREDFRTYTAGNRRLHLSGGITLHGGKEPLYQAADLAGDALDAAKRVHGKDAVNFLDISVGWGEWQQVLERQAALAEVVAIPGAASVLAVIRGGYQDYLSTAAAWRAQNIGATHDGRPQVALGPYIWRLTYQLRRLAARYPAAENTVEKWIGELVQPHAITWLALAARWTDALTRNGSSEQ
jgi:CRISPR-associated protein Csm1